jgi:hypothetical protein
MIVHEYIHVCMYSCACVSDWVVPAISLLENMLDPRTCDSLLRVATKAFICSPCNVVQHKSYRRREGVKPHVVTYMHIKTLPRT